MLHQIRKQLAGGPQCPGVSAGRQSRRLSPRYNWLLLGSLLSLLLATIVLPCVCAGHSPPEEGVSGSEQGVAGVVGHRSINSWAMASQDKTPSEVKDLSQPYADSWGFGEIYNKPLDEIKVTNLLLSSDVEGNIHALNRQTGELVWSMLGNGPLVSIVSEHDAEDYQKYGPSTTPSASGAEPSLSDADAEQATLSSTDGATMHRAGAASAHANATSGMVASTDMTWIIEPYGDGTIYHFTPETGLQKLPASIKQLVMKSPFSLGDDFIYTGVRKSGIVKINARTGELIGSYGLEQAQQQLQAQAQAHSQAHAHKDSPSSSGDEFSDDDLFSDDEDVEEDEETILLGKTVYELSIHSKNDSSWNVTYTSWGPNNLHSRLAQQNYESADDLYIQPFQDSSLLALDASTNSVQWVSNLPYITVNVFDVYFDEDSPVEQKFIVLPHPLNSENSNSVDASNGHMDATYVERTKEGTWFAMNEENYPSLVRSAPLSKYMTSERWRSPSILSNPEFLCIAISGVHDGSLTKSKNDMGGQNLPSVLPTAHSDSRRHDTQHYRGNYESLYRPSDSLRYYHDRLAIEGPPEGYSQGSIHGPYYPTWRKLVYRAFENVVVAFLGIIMLLVISKLGVFQSANKLLNAIGLGKKAIIDFPMDEEQPVKEPHDIISSTPPSDSQESTDEDAETTPTLHESSMDDHSDSHSVHSDTTISEKPKAAKVKQVNFKEAVDPGTSGSSSGTTRRRKRGSRGGRRNRKKDSISTAVVSDPSDTVPSAAAAAAAAAAGTASDDEVAEINDNLSITSKVLGYGSHGTVVFKGFFEDRPVAVKRMLIDFYKIASQEIKLLQESDDHSNVIRYFCSQQTDRFLYIALELCTASLEDVIGRRDDTCIDIRQRMVPTNVLWQIANGLNHLHSLKIVHRDIKPQNILVAESKKLEGKKAEGKEGYSPVRLLISDFGLCKKLEADQSSFRATTAQGTGTSGWRAPELLMDDLDGSSSSSSYSGQTDSSTTSGNRRLTRAIDIFSTGCVFFHFLTNGGHPFGDRYTREGNIIKGEYDLSGLDGTPSECESKDLIGSMIGHDPTERPDTETVMKHPYFWPVDKKLDFLLKVSDRFEVERRDPPSPLLQALESVAPEVVGKNGWKDRFDSEFQENLGKYRSYQGDRLMDLLRAMRNKYHHFQDLPDDLAARMGPLPGGFYAYFVDDRFPNLLMVIYKLVGRVLKDDDILGQFF